MSASDDRLTTWNACLAEAIEKIGGNDFPEKLESALRQLVDFDICMVFCYGSDQTVRNLYHNIGSEDASIVIDDYMAGPFLLDPFYEETKRGRREGFQSLREMAPDRFYQCEYYQRHYIRTGIRDEMGLFFGIAPEVTAVLSVTRQKQKRHFNQAERARFASVANILRVLGSEYWSARADRHASGSFRNRSATRVIDSAFEQFGRNLLSEREREVVAYVLKGHSSASIGLHLEITSGTVKNHRRSAYRKLRISSQAELFSAFVSSLRQNL